MTALFLVAAVGFLGPIVARVAAGVLGPPLARLSPVGGFLASSNLRTATRRFSSASTPLMLTVGHELHPAVQLDHDRPRRHPAAARRRCRASSPSRAPAPGCRPRRSPTCAPRRGVRSAVALTPTTLGPSLGVSDDTIPAADPRAAAQGGGLDVGVTAGSLAGAARRHDRARAAGAPTARTPASATACRSCSATGPARTPRSWRSTPARWGSATRCSRPSSPPATRPARCSATILVQTGEPAAVARRLRALAPRYPGLRVERPGLAGHARPTPTARPTAGSDRCSSRSSSPSRRSRSSTR